MSALDYDKLTTEPLYLVRMHGITEAEFDKIANEEKDLKVEFFDGVMLIHSPASISHENVFMFLRFLMHGYCKSKHLGKVLNSRAAMHLSPSRKFEPDLISVSRKRIKQVQQTRLEGPADLVVEILSESTRDYDLNEKRPAYQQAKITELWFVDLDGQQLMIDKCGEKGYITETISQGRVSSKVLSGFWLKAEWLWEKNLPNAMPCLEEILKGN